jgi:hypothetical protein
MKNQLLYAPVQNLGDVKFVLRRAGHLVNPAKLFKLFSGLAQHAEKLPVEGHFVDAARERIAAIQHLPGAGRDADGPWRAGRGPLFGTARPALGRGNLRFIDG